MCRCLLPAGTVNLAARERFGPGVKADFIQKPHTVMQLAKK